MCARTFELQNFAVDTRNSHRGAGDAHPDAPETRSMAVRLGVGTGTFTHYEQLRT